MPSHYNEPGVREIAYWSDLPAKTLALINKRLAGAGCDYRIDAEDAESEISLQWLEEQFSFDAAPKLCKAVRAAMTAVRPDLDVL